MSDTERKKGSNELIVKTGAKAFALKIENIIYIEKDRRKINVYFKAQGKKSPFLTQNEVITFYGRLKDLTGSLDKRFLWCSRSYIVNMEFVTGFGRDFIMMDHTGELAFNKDVMCAVKRIFRKYKAGKD